MDLKSLKSRHKELSSIIDSGYKNYIPDERLRRLKKEKLRIKEIIEKDLITEH
tara:strand:+ start:1233 stop:1391 length:159 start_codon:yes stop_codon:yes gene_type:complete